MEYRVKVTVIDKKLYPGIAKAQYCASAGQREMSVL